MGRGGEKGASPKAVKKAFVDVASQQAKPWETLPTEELRKKAQRFGHDANADRATLLQELVRIIMHGGVHVVRVGVGDIDAKSQFITSDPRQPTHPTHI